MNNLILLEYLPVLIFFSFSLVLSILFVLVSVLLGPKNTDPEKVSAYECGFNPFDDSRKSFEIRFYLVAILFILFDIEVVLIFPFILLLSVSTLFSFLILLGFLAILTIGFIYEWKKGALNWS